MYFCNSLCGKRELCELQDVLCVQNIFAVLDTIHQTWYSTLRNSQYVCYVFEGEVVQEALFRSDRTYILRICTHTLFFNDVDALKLAQFLYKANHAFYLIFLIRMYYSSFRAKQNQSKACFLLSIRSCKFIGTKLRKHKFFHVSLIEMPFKFSLDSR